MFDKVFGKKSITTGHKGNAILEKLADKLGQELKLCLDNLSKSGDNLSTTSALHLVVDNLTNVGSMIRKMISRKDSVRTENALSLLEEQIEQTCLLLHNPLLEASSQATEIGIKTLNHLFCAKQSVKQQFSLVTKIVPPTGLTEIGAENSLPEVPPKMMSSPELSKSQLIISSTILYQMHHSLFPAEKMLVGAGHRVGQDVLIDAVFEVTGEASSGHVWADANRLSRALISMSETDSYLALWIHSHPGSGVPATFPSQTDFSQEQDWLRDYSKDLVSAIMVKDGVVRFWGKALQNEQIVVSVEGVGVRRISETEPVYKLDY